MERIISPLFFYPPKDEGVYNDLICHTIHNKSKKEVASRMEKRILRYFRDISILLLLMLVVVPLMYQYHNPEIISTSHRTMNQRNAIIPSSFGNPISYQFYENVGQIDCQNVSYYGILEDRLIGFGVDRIFVFDSDYRELATISLGTQRRNIPRGTSIISSSINYFYGKNESYIGVKSFQSIVYSNLYQDLKLEFCFSSEGIVYEFSDSVPMQSNPLALRIEEDLTILSNLTRVTFESTSNQLNEFSTYLGGSHTDMGNDLFVDQFGNVYVIGSTWSTNFPSHDGLNSQKDSLDDCFITKLNSTGTGFEYATFIGGSGRDSAVAVDVDVLGNVYIGGTTISDDFPITNCTFDSTVPNGYRKGFLLKLSSNGNELLYSTYIGGQGFDTLTDISVDSMLNICAVGSTLSSDFPTENSYNDTFGGALDTFFLKLNSTGNGLLY
jgi:hypothetical protein